jgi:hypothetical protein
MRGTVFWSVTPSSPVEIHQRFGGTYCFHPQGVSQESIQQEEGALQAVYFLLVTYLD